jgi:hypothetical protein
MNLQLEYVEKPYDEEGNTHRMGLFLVNRDCERILLFDTLEETPAFIQTFLDQILLIAEKKRGREQKMIFEKSLIISGTLDKISQEVRPVAEENPEGRVFLIFENQQQFAEFLLQMRNKKCRKTSIQNGQTIPISWTTPSLRKRDFLVCAVTHFLRNLKSGWMGKSGSA